MCSVLYGEFIFCMVIIALIAINRYTKNKEQKKLTIAEEKSFEIEGEGENNGAC